MQRWLGPTLRVPDLAGLRLQPDHLYFKVPNVMLMLILLGPPTENTGLQFFA